MMNFAEAMREESTHTFTENGAKAKNTTSNALLDLFGTIGSLRNRNKVEVEALFEEALKVDPLFATKILFYARDIREGCGEREVFKYLINYCAKKHPEVVVNNIPFIGFFGRYDDLYALIDTPLESNMWAYMKEQIKADIENMEANKPVSLLAKWVKTPDASSKKTRALGIKTAISLGYSVYDFKRILRKLRKYIDVVEVHMSGNDWTNIDYSAVPSKAMNNYRNAFYRHDADRFASFGQKAVNGEVKINSSALYPYDIVEKVLYKHEDSDILEAQWRQLPNYVKEGTNAIVMADVSGSMSGRPMATSIGLAMYFAERNIGAYHNLFMTFSSTPKVNRLVGDSLYQRVRNLSRADWGMSTNLEMAFMKVLDIAIKNKIPANEMVKSIIVVSDMEIDYCVSKNWSFYDEMMARFAEYGYEMPNVVFWNVESRNNVFHADATRKGVQLCSGSSVTTFKLLMDSIGLTPVEMMEQAINSDRYSVITIK